MRELLISIGIGEVRAAIVIDKKPFRLQIFRTTIPQKLGGVYWGQVKTIARNLDGAFVDLGTPGGEAFLPFRHARPIAPKGEGTPKVKTISNCVYEGQIIPLEIIREALPKDNKLAQVRARKDIFDCSKPPSKIACISEPPSPVKKAIVWGCKEAGAILFDDMEALSEGKITYSYLKDIMEYHAPASDLFEAYHLDDRIDETQCGQSSLPSGGSVKIEATSALIALDVNSGSSGKGQFSEKVRLKTNIEAAHKIADEIQFQNLGGLMVIDFIDLGRETDRRTLMKVFDGALRVAGCHVEKTGLSKFMLMELRRKKQGPSISELLNRNPIETEALKLLRLGLREGQSNAPGSLILEGIPPLIKWLENNPALLDNLKAKIGREIKFEGSNTIGVRISK
jgi:Ribonuclease G/E